MHLDLYLVLASSVVGLLLGITGIGGGALMTPMLVLVFGIAPSAAISADLMATLFMKPWGVLVHWRRRTIQRRVVGLLTVGSLPAAFLGTYAMHLIGHTAVAERDLKMLLGAALIVGASAMILRAVVSKRRTTPAKPVRLRTLATLAVGVVGGFMVGLTSVGAGSLILVCLMTIYPNLKSDQLVGTDLAQSIPLTLGASAGTLAFGHVAWGLTSSIIVGGVPAVIVGSLISSRAANPAIRHVMTALVMLSGLKYIGLATPIVVAAATVALAVVAIMVVRSRPRDDQPVSPGTTSGRLERSLR
ncbi:MAG TPA: sulfite exporter TauE/SafE family protein [Acidimicrobiales bacterium]|nr:sulfite exporter TauE/SafE family protein [Acidimicrobiales bacterium]